MSCKISWNKFALEIFAIKSKTMGLEAGQLCFPSLLMYQWVPEATDTGGREHVSLLSFDSPGLTHSVDGLHSKLCLATLGWREDF